MQSKEYYRDYYQKNRERILQRKKEYRQENQDKFKTRNKRYWQERRYAERNRQYMRRVYRENKMLADRLKAERGCELCGENDFVCLEWHHRDPEKRSGLVASFCGFSWKKLMEEISKCIVVCANCHAKTHYEERRVPGGMRKRRVRQRELPFNEPPLP